MEQKQGFVSLLTSNRFAMVELCESFGISRKTGHKWKARYESHGMAELEEWSRTEEAVERLIVAEKRRR